jgi:hypothetical protein
MNRFEFLFSFFSLSSFQLSILCQKFSGLIRGAVFQLQSRRKARGRAKKKIAPT